MAEINLDEYNGNSLVGTAVSLLVLTWVTIGLRSYTRAVLMKSFMADDWLMLIAQVSFTFQNPSLKKPPI
jgi:urea transporter